MDTKLNTVERYVHAWRVWRMERMPEIAARRPELTFVAPDLPRGSIRLALEGLTVKYTWAGVVIHYDSSDPAFYAAIYFDNEKAVAGEISPHDLKRIRQYVIYGEGGPAPIGPLVDAATPIPPPAAA
jgi:hypothetical protein